jgi:two-component system, LytTR family, response regulator
LKETGDKMRIILIDDEKSMLLIMNKMLAKIQGVEIVGSFQSPALAYKFIKENKVDLAFVDINMPEENGLDFVGRVTKEIKNIAILYLTAHKEYALEAYGMYAFDYLVKPISQEKLDISIKKAKEKLAFLQPSFKDTSLIKLVFNCLGGLEVKNPDGKNVLFTSSKSLELLAYLIMQKGRFVAKWRIIEDIFPGMAPQNAETYLNTTIYKLRKSLEPLGLKQIIISADESYKIDVSNVYVDVNEFEYKIFSIQEINASNQEDILKTESLFSGELFGDKDYRWAIADKEQIFEVYFSFVKKFIHYLIETYQYTLALHITKKVIKFNETDEETNCLLMKIYALQKDKKLLTRQFDRYSKVLRLELGLYPESTVVNLYKLLINTFT